jgi:glycosyltransferase involved in cell wall biosynthesis
MKILFVGPGSSIHMLRWIDRAESIGVDTVFYPSDGVIPGSKIRAITKPEFGIRFTGKPLFNLLFEVRFLRKLIKAEKPDIVHLHWLFSPTAFALSFIRRQKIVATPWGSDILYTNEKNEWNIRQKLIYKYSLKILIKNINYFTCDADHLKNRLIELGAREENIDIIYFGTNSEIFTPLKKSVAFREKWNFKSDSVSIISNRNFYPVYDVATLVNAFKIVLDQHPNTYLILGGSGSELDNLQKLVAKLDLETKVIFLGKLTDNELQVSVASSDIYVSTSTSDGGIASSVAEAMSSELPVIITEFGENTKWLDGNRNGYSFEIGNVKQLADRIIALVKHPDIRQKMGIAGRQKVVKELNPVNETLKLKKVYMKLITYTAN